jgi:hypothetical protein
MISLLLMFGAMPDMSRFIRQEDVPQREKNSRSVIDLIHILRNALRISPRLIHVIDCSGRW